ncbi:MAG: glycosyltransferase family 4 protein [Verrucomicrobiia bacterium]|jgi:glycosyltransferase involved in cell wall biosynthesis
MRIALIGDFDTFVCRGLERPQHLLPCRLSPGLNLLRGFREIGLTDVHIVVVTSEVRQPTVDKGPFGVLHRLPRPPLSGSASLFLWRRRLILAELKKIQPDIVHGQGTELEYGLTAVTAPYPNVITFHGVMHRVHMIEPPPLFSLSHAARLIEKVVARKARYVISISHEVEDFLRRRRSPARTFRIPNAMAPCFFEVQRAQRNTDRYALLYVGAIQIRKGLLHLVDALAIVQRRLGQPVRLRVIGPALSSGPNANYERSVRARAAELGVAEQIEWMGVQNELAVARAMAASDVLVLPSFWENMPMSVGEAMAAALPVVSTRAAGIPDWVEEGKTGLLVTPGRSDELADALVGLLSDAEMRERLGATARAKALAQYAPRVVAQKTLEVYESILQARP